LFKPAVRIEALLRRPAVRAAYSADLRRDFETIMPHLPQPCRQVLDIGCGIAGIDVLLHRHLDTGIETLHLLDKSAVARQIFYGFNATGAFYNSLSVARGVLSANGVPASRVRTLDATPDNGIPIEGPLDLIISILSWGFHYPVRTYLERAHALLRPGGRLILDVRKGQDGEALLERRFGRLQVALDMGGAVRVVATK
jgi:SAM-dependent methyltransferase